VDLSSVAEGPFRYASDDFASPVALVEGADAVTIVGLKFLGIRLLHVSKA
jgi:hypothetical protein